MVHMYELGVFAKRIIGRGETKKKILMLCVLYYTLFLSEKKKVTSRFPIGKIKRG